ncbi:MAG TPA: RNase adapter RapZ [Nitriliruptorales bacterium]|nr:RNase adapter RapZ [Nitriliruptorales bacterium]
MTALPPQDAVTSEVAVITGMSGAGRTEAAKVLEDVGYYVIDNLPPALIGQVVELASQPGTSVDRIALVTDVRGREFFGELEEAIRSLRQAHPDVRVLFLEADDDTLVRRFEATRRRHPLGESGEAEGVAEGIARERGVLEELRGSADLVIDTTDLNVHELRDRLLDAFGSSEDAAMRVNVVSFGYKYGLPRDADLVMDVRFLPNPHWVDELRPYTGLDDPVRKYVLDQPGTEPFLERFRALLDTIVPRYVDEGKRYLTIAVGCTGGKHRSVVVAEVIAEQLRALAELPVHTDHRDVGRE